MNIIIDHHEEQIKHIEHERTTLKRKLSQDTISELDNEIVTNFQNKRKKKNEQNTNF